MDKNKKGLIILIYKILTAMLLGVNVVLAYNLNVSHNINTEATQKIKEATQKIKEQDRIITDINKELEEIIEKLQAKELAVAEVEEIKYAEAEHKEIEKHLGEEQNVIEEPVVYSSGYTMTCRVTHYSSEETGSNVTASGEIAQLNHTIACNTLPFGTQVRINGIVYTVEDTGDMDGNGIDIYVSCSAEAFERGTYITEVEVL